MKYKEIREAYQRYSGKASALNRQLVFSGFAIVWMFCKITSYGTAYIPDEYKTVILFLGASLIVDLFQYIIQTGTWYLFYFNAKIKYGKKVEEKESNEPEWLNIMPWFFWGLKILLTFIAYYKLAIELLVD